MPELLEQTWVYSNGPSAPQEAGLVPIRVIVAFLAFAASWIIYDNERMISALARYQRKTLAKHFRRALPNIELWELSEDLYEAVKGWHAVLHRAIQGLVVVLPALIGLWFQSKSPGYHDLASCFWTPMAGIFAVTACWLSILTIREPSRGLPLMNKTDVS
jgi:hypothetical protein